MKIIISHDVDHLSSAEHILHDLIIPKLWIRSFIHLLNRKIKFKTFISRFQYMFMKRYHRIEEVIKLDNEKNIPSTFFFGVETGLGMSYGSQRAVKYIDFVVDNGFDVGVHGIDFQNKVNIRNEYQKFYDIAKTNDFGIRMHYVRYDQNTFKILNETGYLYDTTEFNKVSPIFKKPYKVGRMWEFPLCIMDGYIIPTGDLETGIENTKRTIKEAEQLNLPYCTILYHDYQYNKTCYPDEKAWYDWLLEYLKKEGYECISYKDAIRELENNCE